jgi:hypothetical protein
MLPIKNDGQMNGTYSISVPLDYVLNELPDKATVSVIVDYDGFDGERHFQSECTFEYVRGRGLDRKRCRKKSG